MIVGHALAELLDGVRGALRGRQLAELARGQRAAGRFHHELAVGGGHAALALILLGGGLLRRGGLLGHHGRRQRQRGGHDEREGSAVQSHGGLPPAVLDPWSGRPPPLPPAGKRECERRTSEAGLEPRHGVPSSVTAPPGRCERWGGWGAISWPPM